jgi:hypothetical protein
VTRLDRALGALARLHAEVEARAAELTELHGARLRCGRGCASCCVDGLTVFELEAERIRRAHPRLLHEGEPHSAGACALLGPDGSCRVYAERPYVCRTQGLPLRWLEAEDAPGSEVRERRDICPLNLAGPPLDSLAENACFTLSPFEERLARLQAELDGGALRRVPLRSLFARQATRRGAC